MWIKPVDNSEDYPQPVDKLTWATPMPAVIALVGAGIALLMAAAVTDTDTAGRFLVGLGALGLWIIAALAAYQRPRLWIDNGSASPGEPPAQRLAVKRLSGVRTYRLDEISRLEVMKYPRLGRRVPMLEVDVRRVGEDEDRLMIFGRWDLGTNPQDVYDVLDRHGLVP
ncbi:MAG: PH domain-containing protein [Rhodococcus sp. (in: high G+C Gram-positive bacteria)]